MFFSVLASGSNANSTYVDGGSTRVLVDCGLSARQTCKRLLYRGIAPESLDAIVVTHEHSDHIRGISVLSRKYKIPVYANCAAAECLENVYAVEQFSTSEPFAIGGISFTPFSVVHDARDPVGFVLESAGFKLGHATDMGKVTPLVRHVLEGCNALVLESNHDRDLLYQCGYPWPLKQRIDSSHGHLSNEAAAALLQEMMHPELFHVVLAHLSCKELRPGATIKSMLLTYLTIPPITPLEPGSTHRLNLDRQRWSI